MSQPQNSSSPGARAPRTATGTTHRAALLALALAACALSSCGAGSSPSAKNVLIISLDTTRADHLGAYGYVRPTSPAFDSLARQGHLFTDARTVMPTTLPAHTSMFTSLNPRELGVLANGMLVPPSAHTLAERLSEAGFATAAFVSAAPLHPRFGLDQGFDVYDHPHIEERPGDVTVRNARAWLGQRGDERFFCFVHLFDPHTWYTPPRVYRESFGVPPGVHPPARDFVLDPGALTPDVVRTAVDAYDAEIRFTDELLAGLLEQLQTSALRDDTLIVVLSDHGETLGELLEPYGYAFDHGEFLHERELHVPLLVSAPAGVLAAGPERHDELVSVLDLLPTVLELVDLPCREPALGRSLAALMRGESLASHPVLAERRVLAPGEIQVPPSPYLRGQEFAVTTEQWHFVRCEGRPAELFERSVDPEGAHNVAAQHPDVVAGLESWLDDWLAIHTAAAPSAAAGDIDPELLEALRALGYATAVEGD